MALCESQLDNLHQIKSETDSGPDTPENEKKPPPIPHPVAPNLTVPLAVDYRSPRAHFVPPEVELYAVQSRRLPSSSQESGSNTSLSTIGSNASGVLVKRKRGRPRIDKTSPEYLAKSAARKQAREMVAMMNSSSDSIEKRKRGRPRIDKTSPEYLARKRARELEAMEKRAKRQFKRRTTGVHTKKNCLHFYIGSHIVTSCSVLVAHASENSYKKQQERDKGHDGRVEGHKESAPEREDQIGGQERETDAPEGGQERETVVAPEGGQERETVVAPEGGQEQKADGEREGRRYEEEHEVR
ncbi:hypothetical protein EVAR_92833_1 [Eumeta japonica]|uniref:Uncharacterized protein n=1 Tax=Eumeta variegata TaxID=151549 RepID=A0A4C1T9V0_EUMVA|nr:hypothetical protein EVAR_92833_1 [Eumeta japonica]